MSNCQTKLSSNKAINDFEFSLQGNDDRKSLKIKRLCVSNPKKVFFLFFYKQIFMSFSLLYDLVYFLHTQQNNILDIKKKNKF